MIHRFPQYGHALLITGENKREQGNFTERALAELVLHERESHVIRLRVWKCRYITVKETLLYQHFQTEYPSIYAVYEKQYDGYNFNAFTAEYVIIPDVTEAIHFKLKYLC
jgi:hypothetical protein